MLSEGDTDRTDAALSPDGLRFAFEDADHVRVVKVDLATGRRDPLVDMPDAADHFRLAGDVSRDGRFVAATIAEVTTDVHEVTNFGDLPGRATTASP